MPYKLTINGWLNLHKPLGITSAKAVAIVKRNLHPQKIGHAGTLDPLASGVLPLALGEATKTMQFCMDTDKEYEFTVKWGEATATLDCEGEIIARSDVKPSIEQILAILPQFTGEIDQTPPEYSAIKINGQRAYDLARQGVAIEMKSRKINIYSLEMLDASSLRGADHLEARRGNPVLVAEKRWIASSQSLRSAHRNDENPCSLLPSPFSLTSTFRVSCGKGTYIRSLARDIAAALGTLAHVTVLVRTKVGKFSINDAILLEDIEKTVYKDAGHGVLLPVDSVLDDIQVLEFTPEYAKRLRQGQKILLENFPNFTASSGLFIAKCDGTLLAICESGGGLIKPIRVFNL